MINDRKNLSERMFKNLFNENLFMKNNCKLEIINCAFLLC